MVLNRLEPLDRNIQKNFKFSKVYHDQTEEYIALCHAHQLSLEEAKRSIDITNSILLLGVLNMLCSFCGVCKVSQNFA